MPGNYGKPNSVPYFRPDTISPSVRPNKPSHAGRPEFTQKDPHYRKDIARDIVYPNSPEYENFKQLSGILDIGINSSIWNHDDKEIKQVLAQGLAKKYQVNANDFDIKVDRANGLIEYVCFTLVKSAKYSIDTSVATFGELKKGDIFLIDKKHWEFLPKEVQRMRPEDPWVKLNDERAQRYGGKFIMKIHPDIGIKKLMDYESKEAIKEYEFQEIKIGDKFVFVRLPEKLERRYKRDDIFEKISDTQAKIGKVKIDVDPTTGVNLAKDWEEKYKYKEEDIEGALDSLFRKYKVYKEEMELELEPEILDVEKKTVKTGIGEKTIVPIKEFFDVLEEYNVSEQQFFSLMKVTKGETDIGSYVGRNYIYTITIGSAEVEVHREEK